MRWERLRDIILSLKYIKGKKNRKIPFLVPKSRVDPDKEPVSFGAVASRAQREKAAPN